MVAAVDTLAFAGSPVACPVGLALVAGTVDLEHRTQAFNLTVGTSGAWIAGLHVELTLPASHSGVVPAALLRGSAEFHPPRAGRHATLVLLSVGNVPLELRATLLPGARPLSAEDMKHVAFGCTLTAPPSPPRAPSPPLSPPPPHPPRRRALQ